jgi:hypothetical protein
MNIDELSYKQSVPHVASKARAKGIRPVYLSHRDLGTILLDIYVQCIEQAKHWDKLSPTERIMLEQKWTDLMLGLLRIGNIRVMHGLRYKLREQTTEEDELEGIDN